MLTIDELTLSLPAGFEGRADRIARQVADELARLPMTESRTLDHLAVPAIHIDGGASDGRIAARVAAAIAGQLAGPRWKGGV